MTQQSRRNLDVYRDGAWIVSGQSISALATVAGNRLVTEFVDPASFGFASLLQNLVALLRSLCYAPLLNAGYRFYADANRDNEVPGLRQLILRRLLRVMAIVLALLAVALVAWSHASGRSYWLASIVVALVAADVARQFELTLFSAARRQRLVAVLAVIENVGRPLLIVALAWWLSSSASIVLLGTLLSLLVPVAIVHATRRGEGASGVVPPDSKPSGYGADMHRYALGLVPYAALTWVTGVSDRYIIQWLSPNAADVGIYAAAYAVVSQPFIIAVAMLAAALRPVWFNAVAHGDDRAASSAFRQWLIAAVAIGGAGALLCWLLAPWATRILLAPGYSAAATLMPWIALGYFFFSMQQVFEVHLLAHRRTRAVVAVSAAGAVLSVAVTIPLVSNFGMQGAAYACPIYFGGQCALNALMALGGKRSGPQAPAIARADLAWVKP